MMVFDPRSGDRRPLIVRNAAKVSVSGCEKIFEHFRSTELSKNLRFERTARIYVPLKHSDQLRRHQGPFARALGELLEQEHRGLQLLSDYEERAFARGKVFVGLEARNDEQQNQQLRFTHCVPVRGPTAFDARLTWEEVEHALPKRSTGGLLAFEGSASSRTGGDVGRTCSSPYSPLKPEAAGSQGDCWRGEGRGPMAESEERGRSELDSAAHRRKARPHPSRQGPA